MYIKRDDVLQTLSEWSPEDYDRLTLMDIEYAVKGISGVTSQSFCWIDVNEQPPKENDWILFYDGAACEYNFGLYKNGQFYDGRDCLCEYVRYWMSINPPHERRSL